MRPLPAVRVVVRVTVPMRVPVLVPVVVPMLVVGVMVVVGTLVVVLVEMHVESVVRGLYRGDHLDAAVLHPARCKDALGEAPQLGGRTLQDDHLQAMRLVEVDVHRRAHLPAERMLELVEALGEIAHVMVVDERDRRDGVGALGELLSRDLGPGEITEHLGAGAPALLHEGIERAQEGRLHGHPESNQLVTLGHARSIREVAALTGAPAARARGSMLALAGPW